MRPATRVAVVTATTLLTLSGLAACSSTPDQPTSSTPQSSSAAPSSSEAPSSAALSSAAPSSAAPSSAAPSSAAPSSAGGSDSAKTATITIKDYAYTGPSNVGAGTKITVKNEDSEAHTVTTDSGKTFDAQVAPGKSTTFTAPTTPGSYDFHCTYHGNMHGTLKVS